MSALGDFVRERRKALVPSGKELVQISGLSPGHLSDIENGKRIPHHRLLAMLAPALKVPLDCALARL